MSEAHPALEPKLYPATEVVKALLRADRGEVAGTIETVEVAATRSEHPLSLRLAIEQAKALVYHPSVPSSGIRHPRTYSDAERAEEDFMVGYEKLLQGNERKHKFLAQQAGSFLVAHEGSLVFHSSDNPTELTPITAVGVREPNRWHQYSLYAISGKQEVTPLVDGQLQCNIAVFDTDMQAALTKHL